MPLLAMLAGLLLCFCNIIVTAQTSSAVSDPQAISLAQKSMAALSGGIAIKDVTLDVSVSSIFGSDNESGTGLLRAKGNDKSRVDLTLSAGTRSDVRAVKNGLPVGSWKKAAGNVVSYAYQNCWTDAAWFFPALSSLSQTGNAAFIFKYVGQEQLNGLSVQHIQTFQIGTVDPSTTQRLSTADYYLDSTSGLPLAIASFTHPDNDMNTNIPIEFLFANYQAANGSQIPFHFQEFLNGGVV